MAQEYCRIARQKMLHCAEYTLLWAYGVRLSSAIANPIHEVIRDTGIKRIFVSGRTAEALYRKYAEPLTGIPATTLPSTSPANAAWSLERLENAWEILF